MLFRDLSVAVLAAAFALILLVFGSHLPVGTALRMGPGFVPRAVAVGLLLVAAAIAVRACVTVRHRREAAMNEPPLHWRGTASIGLGVLAFAMLIQPIGLIASAIVTVFVSSLAQDGDRIGERALLAGGLSAVAGGVFSLGLGLPLPMLPAFL
ncbi:tripartite tricarboxylate transporter TctB family protein [Ancylobacter sp.]|uniref:tripartite tricarboxylate transporter TctB family protein n=1 Tax=Ancylobacter sp. TaxID=1872567 RepID=UPI003C7D2530